MLSSMAAVGVGRFIPPGTHSFTLVVGSQTTADQVQAGDGREER